MNEAREPGWEAPAAGEWPAGVRALTTRRHRPGDHRQWNLATHVGDDPARVAANRRALAAATGIEAVQWLDQVHGVRCVEAGGDSVARVPEADAAWTRQRRLGLAILTADCVPVVVSDRAATVVGVAHGGWRGLVGGVLENLVGSLPVAADQLVAWLGPAIGPQAYEVGAEVRDAIAARSGGSRLADACCRPGARSDKFLLDLFTLSERLLVRAGISTVLTGRVCTFANPAFFSYRREGRTGRMATLAWLEPEG